MAFPRGDLPPGRKSRTASTATFSAPLTAIIPMPGRRTSAHRKAAHRARLRSARHNLWRARLRRRRGRPASGSRAPARRPRRTGPTGPPSPAPHGPTGPEGARPGTGLHRAAIGTAMACVTSRSGMSRPIRRASFPAGHPGLHDSRNKVDAPRRARPAQRMPDGCQTPSRPAPVSINAAFAKACLPSRR